MKAAIIATIVTALGLPVLGASPVMAATDTEVSLDLSGGGGASSSTTISGITTFDWAVFDSALAYSLSGTTWQNLYSTIQSGGQGSVGNEYTISFSYATYLTSLTGSQTPTNQSAFINLISTDGGGTNQNGDPCGAGQDCYEVDLSLAGTITLKVTEVNGADVLFTFADASGTFDFLLDGPQGLTPNNLTDGTTILSGDLACTDPAGCGGFRLNSNLSATDSSILDLTGINLNTYGDQWIQTYPVAGGTILFSTRTQTTAQDPSVSCSGADCTFTADASTQFKAIPEPGSLALVALGIACAGAITRRRRHVTFA